MPLRPEAQVGPSTGPALWCTICQVAAKHATDNYHLLQKFIQTPQQLFYNFCMSVSNDERNCRSYELMINRTPTYRVQAKHGPLTRAQGWRGQAFRGANEAEVEEDLA